MLVILLRNEPALSETAVRSGEIGDVDLDMMAVICNGGRIRFKEH